MISILKNWTEKNQQVINSYLHSDKGNIVLVLQDDGFLPEGVYSPYQLLTQTDNADEQVRGPLFADLLLVPDLWEIRMFYDKAEIWDEGIKKAEIIYADPVGEHCVKDVRWMMPDGFNYKTDHYNKHGRLFCTDLYSEKGTVDISCYYAKDHSVVLSWEPQNGMITWMEHGRMIGSYESTDKFLTDFCNRRFDPNQTVLFDDIELAKEMSGLHMKIELTEESIPLNSCSNDVLILTNSDQIEQIEILVCSLPELNFHIASKTLMSDKLMNLKVHGNVSLYLGITEAKRIELFHQCSYYLDINYYQEICDAVQEAYKKGLLILGYDTTIHHAEYVLPEYIFKTYQTDKMIQCLRSMHADRIKLRESTRRQYMLLLH